MCLLLYAIMPTLGFTMNHILIDFTQPIDNYALISDASERAQGKSHGVFNYQHGIHEKKHFFFAYLDPQPNGAAFVRASIPFHLTRTANQSLCLTAQGLQKKTAIFQVIITTEKSQKENFIYRHTFSVEDKKMTHRLPLNDFSASYRGQSLPQKLISDKSAIQSVGIQIIGRNEMPHKVLQQGLYGLSLYTLYFSKNFTCRRLHTLV